MCRRTSVGRIKGSNSDEQGFVIRSVVHLTLDGVNGK